MIRDTSPVHGTSLSSVAFAYIQVVVGLFALAAPMTGSTRTVELLALLLMFHGVTQLIYLARIRLVGRLATWAVLVAGMYVGAGVWLLTEPLPGLTTPTVVLIVFFLAQGLIDIIAYFVLNKGVGSIWLLLAGLATVSVTMIIREIRPSNVLSPLGILVGVSMLIAGAKCMLLARVLGQRVGREANSVPERRAASNSRAAAA